MGRVDTDDLTRNSWPLTMPGVATENAPLVLTEEQSRLNPSGPPVVVSHRPRLLVSTARGRRWHRVVAGGGDEMIAACGTRLSGSLVEADSRASDGDSRPLCARCYGPAGHFGHLTYWELGPLHYVDVEHRLFPGEDTRAGVGGRLAIVDVEAGIRHAFDVRFATEGPVLSADGQFLGTDRWVSTSAAVTVHGVQVTTAPNVPDAPEVAQRAARQASTRPSFKTAAVLAAWALGHSIDQQRAGGLLGWVSVGEPRIDHDRVSMDEEVARDVLGLRGQPELPRGQREAAVRQIYFKHRGKTCSKGYERQILMRVRRAGPSAE